MIPVNYQEEYQTILTLFRRLVDYFLFSGCNRNKKLSKMLDDHYRIAPIIIIDEYDTPIHQGHTCNFYDKVILFMRNLFSGGFKDNRHLSYGFLTGILRVAKESIFSGLNNLKIMSLNVFTDFCCSL